LERSRGDQRRRDVTDRLVFGSTRKGVIDLYERSDSGAAPETLLWESPESKNAYDWSSDGRWIVFATRSPKTARDLWALRWRAKKPCPNCVSVYLTDSREPADVDALSIVSTR